MSDPLYEPNKKENIFYKLHPRPDRCSDCFFLPLLMIILCIFYYYRPWKKVYNLIMTWPEKGHPSSFFNQVSSSKRRESLLYPTPEFKAFFVAAEIDILGFVSRLHLRWCLWDTFLSLIKKSSIKTRWWQKIDKTNCIKSVPTTP